MLNTITIKTLLILSLFTLLLIGCNNKNNTEKSTVKTETKSIKKNIICSYQP